MENEDHPLLYRKNHTDKGISVGRRVIKVGRGASKEFKQAAARKTRRNVRLACKGHDIRCRILPGSSWKFF